MKYSLVMLIFLLLLASCASGHFSKTHEYKQAIRRCSLDYKNFHLNNAELCEWLANKYQQENNKSSHALYLSIGYGVACFENLNSSIADASDETVTESTYNINMSKTLVSCNRFFDFSSRKNLGYQYSSSLEAQIRVASLLCEMQFISFSNEFKKNKMSQVIPTFCYKMISLTQEYSSEFNIQGLVRNKDIFTKAFSVSSQICKMGDKVSCELKPKSTEIYNSILQEIKKEEAIKAEENRKKKEEVAQRQAYENEVRQCKGGNKQTCWGLYVANKDSQYGYEHLRDACLLGHNQACQAKQVIDEENQANFMRTQQAQVLEQQRLQNRREEVERSKSAEKARKSEMYCINKNKDGFAGWNCDEGCPGYQHCINMQSLSEQEKMRKKRITNCTRDYRGNYECTER